jgi:hypothetical protein
MLQPKLTRTWWDAGCANRHRLRTWFRPFGVDSHFVLEVFVSCTGSAGQLLSWYGARGRCITSQGRCRTHGKSCRNTHQGAQRRNICILLGVMATLSLGLPRHVVLGFSCELIGPVRPDCPTLRYTVQERVTSLCGSRFITSHFPHESCTPEVTSCPMCA